MKVKINAEVSGQEIIDEYVIPQVKNQGIVVNTGEVKIFALNSKGDEVEIKPDKLKFKFSRE